MLSFFIHTLLSEEKTVSKKCFGAFSLGSGPRESFRILGFNYRSGSEVQFIVHKVHLFIKNSQFFLTGLISSSGSGVPGFLVVI